MKTEFFNKINNRLIKQSTEATLGVLGIKSEPLRKFLAKTFISNDADKGGMISDPVFEAVFPWNEAEDTFKDLEGFLQPSFIDALDNPKDEVENGENVDLSSQALRKDFHPYEHQLNAWKTLSRENPKSIIVTSGTGSGKTECFMVPILNDLVKQHEEYSKQLQGVQALFIYPLNALINSQRKRLLAWTQPYGKDIRFCLYNGNTPRQLPAHEVQAMFKNEVHTREQLWQSPPPVLITNPTMLEYMLIRQEDKPILDKSQGKLKYIVLDEAHTYIGSQAAELSLLIRRTLHAFNVKPEQVRFIATSATIGNDEAATNSLKQYLADLAGLNIANIDVIPGKRWVPVFNRPQNSQSTLPPNFEDLNIDEQKTLIFKSSLAWDIRNFIHPQNGAKSLRQITRHLHQIGYNVTNRDTLKWLDACSIPQIKQNGVHFLPLRGHMFHRILNGLWVCSNPNCSEIIDTPLEDDRWKYGKVYVDQRPKCECGAPVYELSFCNDCNTAHLMATEQGERIIQNINEVIDEFEIDQELEEDNSEDQQTLGGQNEVIISTRNINGLRQVFIDNDGVVQAENIGIKLYLSDEGECPSCGYRGVGQLPAMRKAYLGMPFYNSSIVPTLLENTIAKTDNTLGKPFMGKSLITFTDSRQGTARIAVKMQQDAERNRLRGLVYNIVNETDTNVDQEQLNAQIRGIKGIPQWENQAAMVQLVRNLESQLNQKPSIPWDQMVLKISQVKDVEKFMHQYYRKLDSTVFNQLSALANVLMIREFSRRPRRANSLETLGMVKIEYPLLKRITTAPRVWEHNGLTFEEWKDFLKVILDFFVRDGLFVEINRDWKNWLGGRYSPKSLLPPDSPESDRFNIIWPQFAPERGARQNRIIRLLAFVLNFNLRLGLDNIEIDTINNILQEAWNDLTRKSGLLTDNAGDGQIRLKLEKLSFTNIKEAWYCPVTLRLLDTTLRGITPFLPVDARQGEYNCNRVTLPDFPNVHAQSHDERISEIRSWQDMDIIVTELRDRGIWTNLSDIISEGGIFFRSEEHSAQQDHITLRKYEKGFQDGNINVLSCSTTMEMGVDIGGLSIVMNNNVPPHPSNYLQRAGRAGRRGESRSLSLTLCKNTSLDKEVFRKSTWPFKTQMRQPNITLQSKRIIQRHINAFLFGYFLKNELTDLQQSAIRLKNVWFFEPSEEYQSNCERFIEWISQVHENTKIADAIDLLRKQSILEEANLFDILEETKESVKQISNSWNEEHQKLIQERSLASEEGSRDNSPYVKRINREINRMEDEFLLSELVAGGFLPGYGFPTGIVPFNNENINNFRRRTATGVRREDNNTRYRNMPTRNISLALSEYAPGSQIVIDGKVYRSSGLSLNWHIPQNDSAVNEDQKIRKAWRCSSCGNSGSAGSTFNNRCNECGSFVETSHQIEFIEPAGFAVNFYDEPSNNVSSQIRIPSKESWVIANGSLSPLPSEALGFYKSDSQGHVFTHNSGMNNTGYALCLACGYADSLSSDGELPASFRNHTKLRGNRHEDPINAKCNPGAFQIKWPLHLGSEERTDVFELYLKQTTTGEFLAINEENKKLCWSVGVALRYGLSKCLGINDEEIGVVVNKRRIDKSNTPVYSIGLYDIYGGGSGFSTLAPFYLNEMFRYAKELLDCPDQCSSSCEKCLIQAGQYRISDLLDRHLALDYLTDDFLNLLELQEEDKLLGEYSKFCPENIIQELNRASKAYSDQLEIFLHGETAEWDLGSSSWKQRLLGYLNNFETIRIFINKRQIEQLDEIDKLSLFGLLSISPKVKLSVLEVDLILDRGFLLLKASNQEGNSISYASTQIDACVPGEKWLNTNGHLLVKSTAPLHIDAETIEKEDLLPPISNKVTKLDIKKELNGTIGEFGEKLWTHFEQNSEFLINHIRNNQLRAIEYSDRYLQNPLSVLLLKSIINTIPAGISPDFKVKISSIQSKDNTYSIPGPLFKSWVIEEEQERIEVMENIFSNNDQYPAEILLYEESRELSHARKLTLYFSNETQIEINFDQGMGYWRLNSYARYPFNQVVDGQLEWIEKHGYAAQVQNDGDFTTFMFAKLVD